MLNYKYGSRKVAPIATLLLTLGCSSERTPLDGSAYPDVQVSPFDAVASDTADVSPNTRNDAAVRDAHADDTAFAIDAPVRVDAATEDVPTLPFACAPVATPAQGCVVRCSVEPWANHVVARTEIARDQSLVVVQHQPFAIGNEPVQLAVLRFQDGTITTLSDNYSAYQPPLSIALTPNTSEVYVSVGSSISRRLLTTSQRSTVLYGGPGRYIAISGDGRELYSDGRAFALPTPEGGYHANAGTTFFVPSSGFIADVATAPSGTNLLYTIGSDSRYTNALVARASGARTDVGTSRHADFATDDTIVLAEAGTATTRAGISTVSVRDGSRVQIAESPTPGVVTGFAARGQTVSIATGSTLSFLTCAIQ